MRRQQGFTLIEMLLSVGIIVMLVAVSQPLYIGFKNRNDLDSAAQLLTDAYRRAQLYARAVNGDSTWGVNVQSGTATLYKGAAYAVRDTAYDETFNFSNSVIVNGMTDVVFSKLQATPNTTGSLTLTSVNNDIRTLTLNAKGMVSN